MASASISLEDVTCPPVPDRGIGQIEIAIAQEMLAYFKMHWQL